MINSRLTNSAIERITLINDRYKRIGVYNNLIQENRHLNRASHRAFANQNRLLSPSISRSTASYLKSATNVLSGFSHRAFVDQNQLLSPSISRSGIPYLESTTNVLSGFSHRAFADQNRLLSPSISRSTASYLKSATNVLSGFSHRAFVDQNQLLSSSFSRSGIPYLESTTNVLSGLSHRAFTDQNRLLSPSISRSTVSYLKSATNVLSGLSHRAFVDQKQLLSSSFSRSGIPYLESTTNVLSGFSHRAFADQNRLLSSSISRSSINYNKIMADSSLANQILENVFSKKYNLKDLDFYYSAQIITSNPLARRETLYAIKNYLEKIDKELAVNIKEKRSIFENIHEFLKKISIFIEQKKTDSMPFAFLIIILTTLSNNAINDIVAEVSPKLAWNIKHPLTFMGIGPDERPYQAAKQVSSKYMDQLIDEHGYEFAKALVQDIRVVKLDMPVRDYKSKKAHISGEVKIGYKVYVLDIKKDWTKISFYNSDGDHIEGWVLTRYLKKMN
ncbi:hypothetical protein [Shouchella hunanensis]|uniref:SH3 domain-containing protein n=1 Tax=Shouchella hunanensis TaxID=766894 RepID=A0ABY7W9B1_9BACI|nr:hypothetical protein [Shouchella hunanensis]WDF05512.1 hypothetical protein PQ477_08760 [Shouchella hunanensis]